MVLGSTGTFGRIIVQALLSRGYRVVAAARSADKTKAIFQEQWQHPQFSYQIFDVQHDLLIAEITKAKAHLVINTCGPFQQQHYQIAKACIVAKSHYIDLADDGVFVKGIEQLNLQAQQAGVCVISGASTVPGLSSAVIAAYFDRFTQLDSVRYGVSPGQKTARGLATTKSILSYLGKPLPWGSRYGWQQGYSVKYPTIGKRWMGACDIPDHYLFKDYYAIKKLEFSAGMESKVLHAGIWFVSWLVRLRMIRHLPSSAERLLKVSHCFDRFGTQDGGMHMFLGGSKNGRPLQINWFIEAFNGSGTQIPSAAAIILADHILQEKTLKPGARACINLINLKQFIQYFADFNMKITCEHLPLMEKKTS
jgi:hypothetical protein